MRNMGGGSKPGRITRPRRTFTDEFKAGAVRLVLDEGKRLVDVARDLALFMSERGEGKKTHGGKRVGAGRKKSKYRLDAPHRSRAVFDRPMPVHVTMRGLRWSTGWRDEDVYRALGDVLQRYTACPDFRVIHFTIQDNHLHVIVEAANSRVLEVRMRGFTINAARAIRRALGGCGRVFHRYHSTVIRTKRYARAAIAYVLGNWRRHHRDIVAGRMIEAMLDRYSSAVSFTGWNRPFAIPSGYVPLPVSSPATYLLRNGWAFDGPLDPQHVPGPPWW